jgi:hypothetical protein
MVEAEEDGDGGWRERGIEGKGIRVLVRDIRLGAFRGLFLRPSRGSLLLRLTGAKDLGCVGVFLGIDFFFARSDEWKDAFVGSCIYLISSVIVVWASFRAWVVRSSCFPYCWLLVAGVSSWEPVVGLVHEDPPRLACGLFDELSLAYAEQMIDRWG